MRRRSPKAGTPLNEKQEELARREKELGAKVQELQRVIAEAPRVAEERNRRQREEIITRARSDQERLNAFAVQDKRFGDSGGYSGPRVSLRKERREGRIIFLVLVIALAAAVIFLMTHLPF